MKADVRDRIELPNNAGAVTLYDWMADEVRDGRNLIRRDANGAELWRATPPLRSGLKDCFTNMTWDGEKLSAYPFSGYEVVVDVTTGEVTVTAFTK